jgi:hypothetical protein
MGTDVNRLRRPRIGTDSNEASNSSATATGETSSPEQHTSTSSSGETAIAASPPSHATSFGAAGVPLSAQSPETPGSAHAALGESIHDDTNPLEDPKRPRACEACRGLKVRCEPDPNDAEAPCKRCKKAGRACVVTMPTRKRQKKTDSRVAELEKKIDALTASLQARGGGAAGPTPADTSDDTPSATGTAYGNMAQNSTPRHWTSMTPANGRNPVAFPVEKAVSLPPPPPMVMAGQKRKLADRRDASGEEDRRSAPTPAPQTTSLGHEYSDVVDRGILTMDKAAELFVRYNDHMVQHLPAVVFQHGMPVAELRKSKPLLFLAVMAASSAEIPNLQRQLVKELMQIFAEKVIITGEKTLELVQALHIAVIWYWPPEHFEELKFYQLVHISAVMAIDLGLGRKTQKKLRHLPYGWRDHPFRRHAPPDPSSLECRRTWLTCYFLASNTSMALHRPNLIRWSSFMKECVEVLETSPEAAPTDQYFCHLVWTHKLAEEVGIQFSMDDPAFQVSIADTRTQFALKGLERDLETYRGKVPPDQIHREWPTPVAHKSCVVRG